MRKTLQLFQLCLAIFAIYVAMHFAGGQRNLILLACLFTMYLAEKTDTIMLERGKLAKALQQEKKAGKIILGKKSTSLDNLLFNKNVHQLGEAIHQVLRSLRLEVSYPHDNTGIDRLFWASGEKYLFGLKVVGDISDLNDGLENWDAIRKFDKGQGGNQRLLVIGSNFIEENDSELGMRGFLDFPKTAQDFLTDKHILAMTTQTLHKIHHICTKKNIDPRLILNLMQTHPGGVFRLEQYAKGIPGQ